MIKNYLPRIIDSVLQEYLDTFGAVYIRGPKWCGKTTTAEKYAKSVIKLQDANHGRDYVKLADIDPSTLLQGDYPRLIDEWQLAPTLWDAVRIKLMRKIKKACSYSQDLLYRSQIIPDILAQVESVGY